MLSPFPLTRFSRNCFTMPIVSSRRKLRTTERRQGGGQHFRNLRRNGMICPVSGPHFCDPNGEIAMASCDYCKSLILFGGKKKSGRTFCNDNCLQEGRLLLAADRLPQHAVDAAIDELHQGQCPQCNGPGPVDVHTSHTVWSILVMTTWRSTPHVCCRSCGRQKQLTGLVTSSLFGWWGFPWGVIFTPIQIGKNLSGLFSGPDPEVPSEQLETMARLELAVRAAAWTPQSSVEKPPRRLSRRPHSSRL